MSRHEFLAAARELWGEGLPLTRANVHAAAVGLASQWYRNTDAVEIHAHADGPWSDADMLRKNAWATHLCLRAIQTLVDGDLREVDANLESLLNALIDILPNELARQSLLREKGGAPDLAAEWIRVNGLGNWFGALTQSPFYPRAWWGSDSYPHVVEEYCSLTPGPPDAATFRDRMLNAPWTLTDAQAQFVCDYRYDVGHG